MLGKAYEAQCLAVTCHCPADVKRRSRALTLFALALGSFCIGTSEFATMGILQLFARTLSVSVPVATGAIAVYAIGVVVGAPIITIGAARLNRRNLLLILMAVFVVGNALSGVSANLDMFALSRFVSGLPHGAYFGGGAVVASYIVGPGREGRAFAIVMTGLTVATIVGSPLATFLGQALGWRNTYFAISVTGAFGFIALWLYVPRTEDLRGGPITQELSSLRKPAIWTVMLVAAFGVASIFAVYTFIGPIVTEVGGLSRRWVPVALALFGLGMTGGNVIGGRLADAYPVWGLKVGLGSALIVLALLGLCGHNVSILMATLFGVGMTTMIAIPTIQVRLTRAAPEAPALMGAMNLAALNVANALGAWIGGLAIAAGYGLLSPVWAGFGLCLLGLLISSLTLPRARELAPS
jgi:MFS transporter, DHA1 family, inner membrane transport protein